MAAAFWKRLAYFGRIVMFGTNSAISIKEKGGDYGGFSVKMGTGMGFRSGLGKSQYTQIATKPGVAITVGVGAVSATNLLALAALPAAGTTTFLNPFTLGAGVMDFNRSVRVAASVGVGDGTFVGASAKGVLITGTDYKGTTIKELVPLNGGTAINTKKMFKTVTRVDPALNFVGGTDQVSLGSGGDLGLFRPCQSSSDVLEYGVKASAATSYTITAMPTNDVGEAYTTLGSGGTGDQSLSSSVTTINLPTGTGSAFPSARAMAEIISPDGARIEEIIITAKSTDALTVVRGANGSTARAWTRGAIIAWRPGMSFTPGSITADDRFYFTYLTAID